MNIIGYDFVTVPVTHDGEGLHGVVRALNTAGYYATVVGNMGDVLVMYGPYGEHLGTRMPYVAIVGDTIRVTDRSGEQKPQRGD